MSKVLVVNSGSSSLKFKLFDLLPSGLKAVVGGLVERIGDPANSRLVGSVLEDSAKGKQEVKESVADHTQALDLALSFLKNSYSDEVHKEVSACGHRVVHGKNIDKPLLVDQGVLDAIQAAAALAPLHNPHNLSGIIAAEEIFKGKPQVAVFDTAFHQTLPPAAFTYALPWEVIQEHGVRKYGAHGTSVQYLVGQAAKTLGKPLGDVNLVVAHLGAGASVTAVQGGKSVDTSMGLTPLEGLVMATRCGDIDPAVVIYLQNHCGMSASEVDTLLNKKSGLQGLSGMTDMRPILEAEAQGNERAKLALDVFVHRFRRYLGSYLLLLRNEVDAVVFSAGIGENCSPLRARMLEGLQGFGIRVNESANSALRPGSTGEFQLGVGGVKLLVIPTDEELSIAQQTVQVVAGGEALGDKGESLGGGEKCPITRGQWERAGP